MPIKVPPSKTLTVRLSRELFAAAQGIAHQRDVSLNTLLQESLADTVRAAEERSRYDEYTVLGADSAECDVEYAIYAQAEVMLGAEHA